MVLNFHDEINLALAIDPRFEKAKKRRLPGVQLQVVDHNFSFARKDEGGMGALSGRLFSLLSTATLLLFVCCLFVHLSSFVLH